MTDTAAAAAISVLMARMSDAWARGDAPGYGACFTEDCRYIAFFGGVYRGRAEIVASHGVLFAGPLKGTKLFADVIDLRFPSSVLALLVTRGDVARRRPRRLGKVQSYVAVFHDGNWLFSQFQNTKQQAIMRFLTYRAGSDVIPSLDR